jgi:alpha-D-ribose 1-methylphosphonate 5-triphosphate synthase subunit PhnG
MARARVLHPKLQKELKEALERDFTDLKLGNNPRRAWNSLAKAASIAELLARMGICSDIESLLVIRAGHDALAAVRGRAEATGSWTLKGEEITVLETALERHRIQLSFVSCGEYVKARDRVLAHNKQAKALGIPAGQRLSLRKARWRS